MIGGSGSGKANALLKLISRQADIDKICLYSKDPYEAKYQLLIKHEDVSIKHCNDSKDFIEYSIDMDDVYGDIDDYNPNEKNKVLIMFDNVIANMLSNKKLQPIVTELLRQKIKHFSFFNYAILFCTTKKY